MKSLTDSLLDLIPLGITAVGVVLALAGAHWALLGRHPTMGNGQRFPRQLGLAGLTVAGIIAIVLALPISDSARGEVISLVGILVSGALAFSSSSVLANVMAGIVLRMTKSFHTGDFIRVGELFGRASERGIFDVELQTEQRELVSLSNSYLMAHPVSVVRSSGAIVSAKLSLGYDVHHATVERLLIQAAEQAGLQEAFTQILELGNFAITYRVSGLLVEVTNLLSSRSELHRRILNVLHGADIEILSPSFMAQRPLPAGQAVLPEAGHKADPINPAARAGGRVAGKAEAYSARRRTPRRRAEDIVFDKAEAAGELSNLRRALKEKIQALESQLEDVEGDARKPLSQQIEALLSQLGKLDTDHPPG